MFLLALAPVALDSMGLRIKLAPIAVEIETPPAVGEEHVEWLETQLHLITAIGLENYAAQQIQLEA